MTLKCSSREILCNYLLILGTIFIASNDAHKVKRVHHLDDHKFALEEYLDPEIDERESGPEPPISPLDRPFKKVDLSYPSSLKYSDKLDENIKWDSTWRPMKYDAETTHELGQISGVSITPDNNIAIFHRGERVWDSQTFDNTNRFNPNKGAIREATILLVDKTGAPLLEWGRNMFYMPHGLTVDLLGNYWLTDVAMHQVFKFDALDIQQHRQQLQRQGAGEKQNFDEQFSAEKLFANSPIKPTITLGVPFESGNDRSRFCKPTAVAVDKSGDFFVSDGYCNSRIIKYNKEGERILEWGRTWSFQQSMLLQKRPPPNAFLIPHALALAEEYGYIFVADRENGRVVCFSANNGSFLREYQKSVIGGEIYSVAYAQDRLYLVNGNLPLDSVAPRIRGFVVDVHTGNVLSQFAPRFDMNNPHDLAVTPDSKEIYVVELNSHKVYRFLQDTSKMTFNKPLSRDGSSADGRALRLSNNEEIGTKKINNNSSAVLVTTFSVTVIFIILCILITAMVARHQKRSRLPYTESVVKFQKLLVED